MLFRPEGYRRRGDLYELAFDTLEKALETVETIIKSAGVSYLEIESPPFENLVINLIRGMKNDSPPYGNGAKGNGDLQDFPLCQPPTQPFAFLFLMIMNSSSRAPEGISYLVSGFIVVSLVSSFLGTLTSRVSNVFEPSVLELYS